MRIPIQPVTRSIAPSLPGAPPLQRVQPMTGLQDLAQSFGQVADLRARSAAAQEENFQRVQHEQDKAWVAERTSKDRLNWTQTLEDRKTNAAPDATGFTPGLLSDFDKFKDEALKAAPNDNARTMYGQMLDSLRTQMGDHAVVFEAGQRRSYRRQVLGDATQTDAKTVSIDPSQFTTVLAQRLAAINSSTDLQPADKADLSNKAREQLSAFAATTIADRDPAGFLRRIGMQPTKVDKQGRPIPVDADAAAKAVANDPVLSNLTPQDLRSISDRASTVLVHEQMQREAEAERAARRAEIMANKRERAANSAYTILSNWARDGVSADPVAAKPLLDAISGTQYQAAYAEQAKQVVARTSAAALSIPQQRAQLDQLYAMRNTKGTNQPLEHEIKMREEVISAADRDFREDPLGAALKRGLIPAIQPVDLSNPASLRARADQAMTVSAFTGAPAGILQPEEAKQWASMLERTAPAEKEAVVKRIMETIGPGAAMETFKQVGKDAPLLAVAGGLAGQQTATRNSFLGVAYGKPVAQRSVSQMIFEGEDLLKNKQVELPEQRQRLASFQDYLGNAIPNPQARSIAQQAVDAVYAKLIAEAGRPADKTVDSGLYRKAASFVTGNVIEYNGQKILPPAWGMHEDQARDVLRGVTAAQVKAWGSVAGMTDEQAAQFIKSAPLESQTVGKYRVLAGSGILQRKDGSPFEMRF